MKIKHSIFLAFLLGFSTLWAQTSEILKTEILPDPDNPQALDLQVELQLSSEYRDGFFIELPQGLTTVVKSITRDGQNQWLINSEAPIEQKNVIAWYAADDGLYFHYELDDLSGALTIELVPDNKKLKRFDTFETKLYPVTREAENIVAQQTESARSNVSVKQTIQGNE